MAPSSRFSTYTVLFVLLATIWPNNAFFFSSRAKSASPAPAQWYSIRDYSYPVQSAYSYDTVGGVTVAVPVAVPIAQEKLSPAATSYGSGAPVQLVPCLCPISRDPDSIKASPSPVNSIPGSPASMPSGAPQTNKQR